MNFAARDRQFVEGEKTGTATHTWWNELYQPSDGDLRLSCVTGSRGPLVSGKASKSDCRLSRDNMDITYPDQPQPPE